MDIKAFHETQLSCLKLLKKSGEWRVDYQLDEAKYIYTRFVVVDKPKKILTYQDNFSKTAS